MASTFSESYTERKLANESVVAVSGVEGEILAWTNVGDYEDMEVELKNPDAVQTLTAYVQKRAKSTSQATYAANLDWENVGPLNTGHGVVRVKGCGQVRVVGRGSGAGFNVTVNVRLQKRSR